MTERRLRHWPSITGSADQRASNALTRLEDITRLVAEWVWEIDHAEKISFISPRVTEDTGFLPVQLIGKRLDEIGEFINSTGEPYTPDWKQPFRNVSFKIIDNKNIERKLLISGIPNFDWDTGKFTGMCGTARDTSEIDTLKKAERDLEQANTMLQEATRAKSKFLANMSHELRTPLNAIMGFSQIMKFQSFGPLGNSKYLDYADDIYDSGNHLLSLISDILDLSKIEAGKFDLDEEDINLQNLMKNCISMVTPSADEGHIQISYDINLNEKGLYADSRLVRQIVLNLLSNAIKYTPEGGQVKAEANLAENGGISIAVADTGIGIPKDSFEKVLTPFGQVIDVNKINEKGTGLGLAITKSFAEQHGGSITIESEVNQGTKIFIVFPPERTLLKHPELFP
ncbi:MAG: PAS domain-containing sensor histidine kinase [Rhodospirillales bacterium]|jgi:signal transduction histidine kinase|nr:PAS domain-containing sensor histidine kinase [Rhodospirillales bacterium]